MPHCHKQPPTPPQRICNIAKYIDQFPTHPWGRTTGLNTSPDRAAPGEKIPDAQKNICAKYAFRGNVCLPSDRPLEEIFVNRLRSDYLTTQDRFGRILPALAHRYRHREDQFLLVDDCRACVLMTLRHDDTVSCVPPIHLIVPPGSMPYWTFDDQEVAEIRGPMHVDTTNTTEGQGYTATVSVVQIMTRVFHFEINDVEIYREGVRELILPGSYPLAAR